jgi:hypothetical protein
MMDENLDASHDLHRNDRLGDLNLDANLDVMSHHVMLMGDLNMSCDRMSHDHLQYDHRMMHRRDMNLSLVVMILVVMILDVMILDGKMMNHRVIRRMKVGPKTDDRKMI